MQKRRIFDLTYTLIRNCFGVKSAIYLPGVASLSHAPQRGGGSLTVDHDDPTSDISVTFPGDVIGYWTSVYLVQQFDVNVCQGRLHGLLDVDVWCASFENLPCICSTLQKYCLCSCPWTRLNPLSITIIEFSIHVFFLGYSLSKLNDSGVQGVPNTVYGRSRNRWRPRLCRGTTRFMGRFQSKFSGIPHNC